MADTKKIVQSAVLILLAGAAVGYAIWSQARKTARPSWVGETMITKIDIRTGELIEKPLSYWEKLGPDKNGYYLNEKTGERSIYDTIKCASCGQRVPIDAIPIGGPPVRPTVDESRYVCPKCGGMVYHFPRGAAREASTPGGMSSEVDARPGSK